MRPDRARIPTLCLSGDRLCVPPINGPATRDLEGERDGEPIGSEEGQEAVPDRTGSVGELCWLTSDQRNDGILLVPELLQRAQSVSNVPISEGNGCIVAFAQRPREVVRCRRVPGSDGAVRVPAT